MLQIGIPINIKQRNLQCKLLQLSDTVPAMFILIADSLCSLNEEIRYHKFIFLTRQNYITALKVNAQK